MKNKFQLIVHTHTLKINGHRASRMIPHNKVIIRTGPKGASHGGIANRLKDIGLSLSISADKYIRSIR